MKLEAGRTFGGGRYELAGCLGQGGQAAVWEALQRGLGGFQKTVVLKIILLGDEGEKHRHMLLQEARILSLLRHVNLVEIYEVGEDEGCIWLAMEYIRGFDLYQLQEKHRQQTGTRALPWPVVLSIGQQLCRGLQYAHTAKDPEGRDLHLIHRDLKPQNVLLRSDGYVKLIDFGIAKSAQSEAYTKTGNVKGTPAYMSPEQLSSEGISPRSDLFSLAVILYEMLGGENPFLAPDLFTILFKVAQCNPPPLAEKQPGLPPDVSALLTSVLQRDPAVRLPSAVAFQQEIERSLRRHQVSLDPDALALWLTSLASFAAAPSPQDLAQTRFRTPESFVQGWPSPPPVARSGEPSPSSLHPESLPASPRPQEGAEAEEYGGVLPLSSGKRPLTQTIPPGLLSSPSPLPSSALSQGAVSPTQMLPPSLLSSHPSTSSHPSMPLSLRERQSTLAPLPSGEIEEDSLFSSFASQASSPRVYEESPEVSGFSESDTLPQTRLDAGVLERIRQGKHPSPSGASPQTSPLMAPVSAASQRSPSLEPHPSSPAATPKATSSVSLLRWVVLAVVLALVLGIVAFAFRMSSLPAEDEDASVSPDLRPSPSQGAAKSVSPSRLPEPRRLTTPAAAALDASEELEAKDASEEASEPLEREKPKRSARRGRWTKERGLRPEPSHPPTPPESSSPQGRGLSPEPRMPMPKHPVRGTLRLSVSPPCELFEGVTSLGFASSFALNRPAGSHTFRCRNPRVFLEWIASFAFQPGQDAKVERKIRFGKLHLFSSPWSEIHLSPFGRIGQSQQTLDLPEGTHTLVLYKEGSLEHRRSLPVTIKPGVVLRTTFVWKGL